MRSESSDMISAPRIKIASDFHHKYQVKISSRHGSVKNGVICLIEEVVYLQLCCEHYFFDLELSPHGHIIHEIGIERGALGHIIAGGSIPFTEGVVLIGDKPSPVREV